MTDIIVARHAGYCMGVHKAFDEVFSITAAKGKIAVFGDMVHNRFALKELTDRGILILRNLDEILENPEIEIVVIRAHGIPPDQETMIRMSGKTIRDLTCPKVKKVQQQARQLSQAGHTVIIYGKTKHPEVIGIRGYIDGPCQIIRDERDIVALKDIEKPALICQTTMNSIQFENLAALLKKKYPAIVVQNTLCGFPVKKQDEAMILAERVDAMLIVGDRTSANTMTLFEKVKTITRAWFIETTGDIPLDKLQKATSIALAGGSSTPEWQIEEIRVWLEVKLNKADSNG